MPENNEILTGRPRSTDVCSRSIRGAEDAEALHAVHTGRVTRDQIDIQLVLTGRKWKLEAPADESQVQRLVNRAGFDLPEAYLSFMLYSNGGEGSLGIEPKWFELWPADEVIQENINYNISEHLPGFLGFGSNGGGELLAFDVRDGQPYKIVMVPFIPMKTDEAIVIASSFEQFIYAIGREEE